MKYFFFFFFLFQLSFSQNSDVIDIGQNLIYENKLDEATIHYNKSLKNTINEEDHINVFLGLAEVYKLKLNYNKSNEYYNEAHTLIKKTKNIQLEFLYYVRLGEFYRRRHMIPEFELELEKAKKILKFHKIEDRYLTKYYNRKAALFTEYYHIDDSTLIYANKSLELAKKVKDKDNIFYSTLEIAGVYERKKEYKTSIKYIEYILDYSMQNNMIQQHSDANVSYIMALIRDNQKTKAIEEALKARKFAQENNLLIDENHFNEYINQIYLGSKNYEKAYEYLSYNYILGQKLITMQFDKDLIEIETKYKSKEKMPN